MGMGGGLAEMSLGELEGILVQAFVVNLRKKMANDQREATYRVTLTVEEVRSSPELAGLVQPPPDPETTVAQHELRDLVHDLVNGHKKLLTERERKALCLRFGLGCEEHTVAEAAHVMGISGSSVRHAVTDALRKLRKHSKCSCLKQFHR